MEDLETFLVHIGGCTSTLDPRFWRDVCPFGPRMCSLLIESNDNSIFTSWCSSIFGWIVKRDDVGNDKMCR